MGLYTELPSDIQEVDIIIAGGGTSGCVLASRLAEADSSTSILVVESGSSNYDNPGITHPVLFFGNIMPESKNTVFHNANRSPHLADREVIVPSGGVLGGGSSINFMMYSRPQRSDLDDWETPGWSMEEMLPYFKKFETYHGKGQEEVHGSNGPIHISGGTFRGTKSENDFLEALEKVGWPEVDDMQNFDNINGAQRAMRFVSPDGKRQDVAHQYLHPLLNSGGYPNLHVVCESQVDRVIFDKTRAVGITYRQNPKFSKTAHKERTVMARKLVVLSCGTFGTPSILERSGVGDPAILERAGVSVVADLPGVGVGYQDHQLALYAYKTNLEPEDTLDVVSQGRLAPEDLVKNNSPLLGYNGQDVTCKLRPTAGEVSALGPNFEEAWNRTFRDKPDKPLVLMSLLNCFPGVDPELPRQQYLGLSTFSVYPFSRGHVHITGKSLDAPVDFDTGFFADANSIDLKKHVWAYKKQREIMRRMACYRGEYAALHPAFSATSAAACVETDGPLPNEIADIEYTTEDDAEIERFLRKTIGTTWHSLGTCKMAAKDEAGAVDAQLNVHDVQCLKVVDLSIVPKNVGANTNSTALAVGEKAADIIIQELKLDHN